MFLLRTGESLDIKIDSFLKSLKPFLSRNRLVNNCLIYLLFCKCCGKQYLEEQLTTLGIHGITLRKMMENIDIRTAACNNICFNILTVWDTMVSLTMFQ